MGMNCDSCLDRCKAECCKGPIPMPATHLTKYPQIRPVTHVQTFGEDMVVAMHVDPAGSTFCPFIGLDNKCSIYLDRPPICRIFGSEVAPMMTCSYQAKDGRIRDGKERRAIHRSHQKDQKSALQRLTKP